MGASNCPERHREVVAAAASLKACLRALATAVDNQQQQPSATAAKVCDAAGRTVGAAEELKALLRGAGAGDVPQWLPLASSRRLVELNLPDALAALLDACSSAAAPCGDEGTHAAALWPAVHGAAECMALIGSVAGRASARSPEPLEVLLQIAGGPLAAACTRYLQHAAAAAATDGSAARVEAAVSAAAALTAPFGALVAAATAAVKAAGELRAQLVDSCCGAGLLAAACGALMTASRRFKAEGAAAVAEAEARVARACEDAAAGLLSLAVYLATPRPCTSPDDSAAGGEPGSPLSGPLASSPMFSYVLATAGSSGGTSGGDSPLASSGCGDTPKRLLSGTGPQSGAAAVEPEVLIALGAPGVRAFLEERLKHVLHEAKGNSKGPAAADDVSATGLGLLPGRAAAASSEGPLGVARSVLLCWRAVLLSTGDSRRALADPAGGAPALMAAVLTACVGQAGSRSSWGAAAGESAVARCVVAACQCLQAVIEAPAGCPPTAGPGAATALLRPAAAAAAWAAGAAAAAWDAAKAKRTGHELPYSRQIKCADRATAQALESCGAAATAAIALTHALLAAATAPAAGGLFCEAPAAAAVAPHSAWAVVASSGILPALEALLRRVPPTSAAHVAAAALLADLLPCMAAPTAAAATADDNTKEAAAALVTLRKFMARAAACGVGQSEATAAGEVAAAGVRLLGALLDEADATSACCGDAGAASGGLVVFAVAQLVPGLQALIAGLPKSARSATLAASLLSTLSRAADARLGLTPILLAHGSAAFCATALTRAPTDTDPSASARLIVAALAFADALVPVPGGECCAVACARPAVAPALGALLQSRLLAELQAALARMADAQAGGGPTDGVACGSDGRALTRTASAPPMQAGAPGLLSSFSLRRTATGVAASPFAIATGASGGAADGPEATAVVLGSSAPAAGPCFVGPCLSSCTSFASAGSCSAGGLWGEAAALQELKGRLDAAAMRAASAALALYGAAAATTAKNTTNTSTAGGVPTTEAVRAPAVRAGPEEALASLRAAAAAAAAAARPAVTSADGALPWSAGGVVRGSSAPLPGFESMEGAPVLAWGTAPSSDAIGPEGPRSPNGSGNGIVEGSGAPLPLLYSVGSADGALGAEVDDTCASPTAAGATDAIEPLPAEISKRLLRALQAATPAVVKATAVSAGFAVGGTAPVSPAAAVDPQTLPRALPALAAFRVGCWSATCTSMAGTSEAAAPLKPCAGGCGGVRYCSRACASAAYAAHLPDCRPPQGACAAGACPGSAFA